MIEQCNKILEFMKEHNIISKKQNGGKKSKKTLRNKRKHTEK